MRIYSSYLPTFNFSRLVDRVSTSHDDELVNRNCTIVWLFANNSFLSAQKQKIQPTPPRMYINFTKTNWESYKTCLDELLREDDNVDELTIEQSVKKFNK